MSGTLVKTVRLQALQILQQRGDGSSTQLLELCGGDEELAAEVQAAAQALAGPSAAAPITLREGHAATATGREAPPPPPAPSRFPSIPGYQIDRFLARGGMGEVYRARQLALNRVVALKMIRGNAADLDDHLRFQAEAEAVAQVQHANIVQIFEVGQAEGRPWFALEYVSGGSLHDWISGRPQPPSDAARWVATLARALQVCHDRGIVHRDLKPANILLSEPATPGDQKSSNRGKPSAATSRLPMIPKIADFGLVKRGDSGLTETGMVLGTPSYMAPEQAAAARGVVGPASDQWALGAILYELLTGRPPFLASTSFETVNLVLYEEPVPPRRLQPAIPRDLETICLKCLSKPIASRYACVADLADDLDRFLNNEPIRARPAGWTTRLVRWSQRHPAVAVLLGTLAFVILAALTTLSFLLHRVSDESLQKEKHLQELLQARDALNLEQRETAKDLWHVVFDVNRGLAAFPDTLELRRKLLDQALARATKLDPRAELMEGVHHSQVGAHNDLGDLYRELGRTLEARQQYESMLEHARRLLAEKQGDEHYQDEIFVAGVKVMDCRLAQGELALVRDHYRGQLQRFEKDTGSDKKRLHQQCHVLNRLAMAALEAEDLAEARASAELFLSKAGPFPPMLVLARRHLGDSARLADDQAQARQHFVAAVEQARKNLAANNDRESRRLLAEALGRLAEMAPPAEAEPLLKEGLALVAAKASGIDLARDGVAARLLEAKGGHELQTKQATRALASLTEAEKLRRKLAEDATHLPRQADLARCLSLLADTLQAAGDTPKAAEKRTEANALWSRLHQGGRIQQWPRLRREAEAARQGSS